MVNTHSTTSIHIVLWSGLDFATFGDSLLRRKWSEQNGLQTMIWFQHYYFITYVGNIVLTWELAWWHGDKIVTTAVHPGWSTREI